MRVAVALLLVVVLSPSLASLAEPAPPVAAPPPADKLCPKCKTTGRLENPIDPKIAEMEAKVLRCSWVVSKDKKGRGLPFVPCGRCLAPSKAAEVQAEFDPLAAEIDAWMEANDGISKTLRPRKPFLFLETTHFDLVFGLPKVKLGKRKTLDMHAAAHLYAERLESLYAWFQETLDYDDELARVTKHQVFLLPDLRTLMTAAMEYAQTPTDRAGRAVGDPSVFVTWRDKAVFKSDASFHQHVSHHMIHQFLGVYFLKIWLVEKAGWLEEGLANYAEMTHFERAGNSCNTEDSEEDMADENWESPTRKLVERKRQIPFAELKNKRADQLGRNDHLQAWSIVDWMMRTKPENLPLLIRDLKQDVPLRTTFKKHYGHSIVGFDLVWQEWVKENYSLEP